MFSGVLQLSHNAPVVCPSLYASFFYLCQGKDGAAGRTKEELQDGAETHLLQTSAGGCLRSSHPKDESVGLQPWDRKRRKILGTEMSQ